MHRAEERCSSYLLQPPPRGANPGWLVEDKVDKSVRSQKGSGSQGLLPGSDFRRTFSKNKQEPSHTSGNPVSKLLRGLGFSFRDEGRTARGSGPRPRAPPRPLAPPPPWPRPARLGMLNGPGRAGRFAWLPPITGAGSARRRRVSSPRLVPGKLGVDAGFRRATGRAAGTAAGPGTAEGRAGGADVAELRELREAERSPHSQGGAGRTRPAEQTRAGQRPGVPRTFVRVESPPRGPGLSGRPRPQPRSLPRDVYLGCGVRSRRAGGVEFRVRGTVRGAGGRQDVRQIRGRQGERLRGLRGPARVPPRPALLPLPAGGCPGTVAGGPGCRGLRAAGSPAGGAAGDRADLRRGGGRAEPPSRAGASPPASPPGSGSRRAGKRNRSRAGELGVGSRLCGHQPGAGGTSGLGLPPLASR